MDVISPKSRLSGELLLLLEPKSGDPGIPTNSSGVTSISNTTLKNVTSFATVSTCQDVIIPPCCSSSSMALTDSEDSPSNIPNMLEPDTGQEEESITKSSKVISNNNKFCYPVTAVKDVDTFNYKYTCPHCCKSFFNESDLYDHDECFEQPDIESNEFRSGTGLLKDVGMKLDGCKNCTFCNQTFDTDKALELHLKFMHDHENKETAKDIGYELVYEFQYRKKCG